MALHESQLTLPARRALNQAAGIAVRSGNTSVTVDHLLYVLLRDPDSDVGKTLAGLTVDTDKLTAEMETASPTVQADVTFVRAPGQKTEIGRDLQAALEDARGEAIAADAPQIDSRALLLGALHYADTTTQGLLAGAGVDESAVRAFPQQIDETALSMPEQPQPAERRSRRRVRAFSLSPIFVLLVAAMLACLYLLWINVAVQPFFVFVFIITGWIVSLALHEFGHAATAYIGGDDSVVAQGYLTLNPLKYTHPLLSIVMPLMILLIGGIGLPGGAVYINRHAIRSRWMHVAVSAAGPLANILFAGLLLIPFYIYRPNFETFEFVGGPFFWVALATQIMLQITAVFINLLPIPGLDGYGILEPMLPDSVVHALRPLRAYGIMILIALFWYVDPFQEWFWTSVFDLLIKLSVSPELAFAGLEFIQFWNFF